MSDRTPFSFVSTGRRPFASAADPDIVPLTANEMRALELAAELSVVLARIAAESTVPSVADAESGAYESMIGAICGAVAAGACRRYAGSA